MFTTFGASARRALTIGAAAATMVFPLTSIGAGAANASSPHGKWSMVVHTASPVHAGAAFNCSGGNTPQTAGGIPPGTYSSVTVVKGICAAPGGVTVTGNLTVLPNATLAANFGSANPAPPTLTVDGNLVVEPSGTAFLGCSPASQCLNDPAQSPSPPTFVGTTATKGSILANDALGVVVHSSTVGGDFRIAGGGGLAHPTPACLSTPAPGVFGTIGAPVFSDIEDSTVGGNISVTNLSSCWLGSLRDKVSGSATYIHDTLGDPDADEFISNTVGGNMICVGDEPAVQFGDSALEFSNHPNRITGYAVGECSFSVEQPNPAFSPPSPFGPGNPAGPPEHISVPSGALTGYTMAAADGGVFPMGAHFFGAAAPAAPTPYVGIATDPGGLGYVVANANGGVDALGAGALLGLPGTPASAADPPPLNKPVVGAAASPSGDGYWTAAADGGVFQNGASAAFFGSLGDIALNKPVTGIAPALDGQGYYLVAGDGGVFPFGPGTSYQGSTGSMKLNKPVVGIAVDPATGGYWLVGADGGVFGFNAPFFGSLGNIKLNKPIVGIMAAPNGQGYYLVAADGGIFPLGPGTHFQGSLGSITLNAPVTGGGLG